MTGKPSADDVLQDCVIAPRGRPSQGVREAILAATLDLAQEQGLARLTTREVARRAKASEASIFYHFGDKAGLLQHAVLYGLKPLSEIDPTLRDGAGESTLGDSLLAIARSLESFFDRVLPLVATVAGDATLREGFRDRMAERHMGPHRGVELLASTLRRFQERGLVDQGLDTESVALSVIGTCMLRSWQRQVLDGNDGELPSLERVIASTVAQISAR